MDVSVIVVAWNVKQFVQDCLKSVYDETKGIEFEVIYVDNGSEDGTVEMVRAEFPQTRIIENADNKGFIVANNQGIEIARGRYVLLLNSDTIVLEDAIAKTVEFTDAHQEAAVVGCRVLNPDRTLQRSCFMYPSILNSFLHATYLAKTFPRSKFFGRERMTWWDFDDVREVETVVGCYALVRREAIEQVGVMDDIYFTYGDDIDWCYRFHQAGWKILFTPEPTIIHYGGKTTEQLTDAFLSQLCGSRLIFMKKFWSSAAFPVGCVLEAMFFLLRAPYWFLRGLLSRRNRGAFLTRARACLRAGSRCLMGWTRLLMNREEVEARLTAIARQS